MIRPRSMRAGTVAPATPARSTSSYVSRQPSLNEGRDGSPGNTSDCPPTVEVFRPRSMRAGTVAPATRLGLVIAPRHRGLRSMRAGTVAPATPVVGPTADRMGVDAQ